MSAADIAARCRPHLAVAIYVLFIVLPVLGALRWPPPIVWKLATLAGRQCG